MQLSTAPNGTRTKLLLACIDGMDLNACDTLMRQKCRHFGSDSPRRRRHPRDGRVNGSGGRRCLGGVLDVDQQRTSALRPRGWQDGGGRRRRHRRSVAIAADNRWLDARCACLFAGVVAAVRSHRAVAEVTGGRRRRPLIRRVHPVRVDRRRVHCRLIVERCQHYVCVTYQHRTHRRLLFHR